MDVKQFVLAQVQECLYRDVVAEPNMDLKDSAVTSLELLNIVMECEKKYAILIPADVVYSIKTPQELIDIVQAKLVNRSLNIAP